MQEKSLAIRTTRELALSICTLGLALALPQIFHSVGLGKEFLPLFIPVILLAFTSRSIPVSLVTALAAPFLSMVVTGMPAPHITLILSLELGTVLLFIQLLKKTGIYTAVFALPVIITGRVINLLALVLWNTSHSVPLPLSKAWNFVSAGWPGMVLLILLIIGMALITRQRADDAR